MALIPLAGLCLATAWLAPPTNVAAQATALAERTAISECTSSVREEGVAACRHALELSPDTERSAIVYSTLAVHLADLERWEEATDACRQLVRLRPEDPEAHWRLGDALLFGLNRPGDAEAALREAIHLDPTNADAHVSLGAALSAQGRHDEAVAEMEEARRLDPRLFDTRPASHEIYRTDREGQRWPQE